MPLSLAAGELEQIHRFYAQLQSVAVEAVSPEGTVARLIAARANRFRLEWLGRTVVCDGQTIWNYMPERRQVIISSAARLSPPGGIEAVLTALLQRTQLRLVDRMGDSLRVELIPSDSAGLGFRKAVLTLRRSRWTPVAIELTGDGWQQRWQIRSFRANPPVTAADFRFTPPEGTEVLDLRR
jgi:outer membrane lipoprotein-sorting protein